MAGMAASSLASISRPVCRQQNLTLSVSCTRFRLELWGIVVVSLQTSPISTILGHV